MKKVLTTSISIGILALPLIALAASPETPPSTDVMATIDQIQNYLFGALIVIAAIFIIIAGYFFITAQGDPEKVKTARNFVLYAVIGVLVAFLSRGFVELVRRMVV